MLVVGWGHWGMGEVGMVWDRISCGGGGLLGVRRDGDRGGWVQVQQAFLRLGAHKKARGGSGDTGEECSDGTGVGIKAVFHWISTAQRLLERRQALPRPPSTPGRESDASHIPTPGRSARRSSRVRCDSGQPHPSRKPRELRAQLITYDGGDSGMGSNGNGGGSCEAVLGFAGGDGSFKRLHGSLQDDIPANRPVDAQDV